MIIVPHISFEVVMWVIWTMKELQEGWCHHPWNHGWYISPLSIHVEIFKWTPWTRACKTQPAHTWWVRVVFFNSDGSLPMPDETTGSSKKRLITLHPQASNMPRFPLERKPSSLKLQKVVSQSIQRNLQFFLSMGRLEINFLDGKVIPAIGITNLFLENETIMFRARDLAVRCRIFWALPCTKICCWKNFPVGWHPSWDCEVIELDVDVWKAGFPSQCIPVVTLS